MSEIEKLKSDCDDCNKKDTCFIPKQGLTFELDKCHLKNFKSHRRRTSS